MILKLKYAFETFEAFVKNIYESLVSIIKILVLSKFGISLPKANENACAVLGNGPSLKESLIKSKDFFLKHPLFCVNLFPSAPEFGELKPGNLIWLDSGFYIYESMEELYLKRPDIGKTIDDLISKTFWPLNLYIPEISSKATYLKDLSTKNQNISIQYYNYTIVKGFPSFENFFFKRNLGMPACENVLGASLFLAINAGFKNIYLFGADHSWIENIRVNENNETITSFTHFYTNKEEVIEKKVKFPGSDKSATMVDIFKSYLKTFKLYYILDRYSKSRGTKIYNASAFSYIDVFERKIIQ